MKQDAPEIVVATSDRKRWTMPMVIVSELQETAVKGAQTGDYYTVGGLSYGS